MDGKIGCAFSTSGRWAAAQNGVPVAVGGDDERGDITFGVPFHQPAVPFMAQSRRVAARKRDEGRAALGNAAQWVGVYFDGREDLRWTDEARASS